MVKTNTQSYTLTVELISEGENSFSVLETLSHSATSLYNCVLGEALKRWHSYERDPEYNKIRKEYAQAKKNGLPVKLYRDQFKACAKKNGYTLNQLEKYINEVRKSHFSKFGAAECQQLAKRAFNAVEKIHFGQATRVRFRSMRDGTSFEGKSHTSKLHYDRQGQCICYDKYRFPVKVKPNDTYAMLCLMDDVKYVRVLRRVIRGHVRWYAQLVLSGIPPTNQRHPNAFGSGRAGIDPGVSTMAFVSENDAKLYELAPDCLEDEMELRRTQRAMERSRRATNPDNYMQDGTIKKGRLKWNNSKRYIRLLNKMRELYRRCKVKREISHHILAKRILRKASFIKTETMSYRGIAKRSGKTTHNRSNGKFASKKRYGKTIRARAPARLIAILNEKLKYVGRTVETINTRTVRASQYNPLDGAYQKKTLRDRMIDLGNNVIVQRDLLSAYCILYTTDNNTSIDPRSAYDHFGKFKQLCDCEVERLHTIKQLGWYTA